MSLAMSPREMLDFLSERNIARMATIRPDNSPHVTPVWYLWENNQLLISVGRGSVKARNIGRNNKVAVTIDSRHGGVIIEGTAKIEELSEEIRRKLCQRYVHPEDLDKYIEYASANFQSILLRIHPQKIISWDYTKDPFLGSLRQMRSDY